MNEDAAQATRRLALALRDPKRYRHPVTGVELIETHISYVLIAGEYAYKIKKPVNLGFLDFTELARRRWFCEEEIRINRRAAADLYLDVIPITGTHAAPCLGGEAEPIEYAVRMRAFPQEALCDRLARRGALTADIVDALAASVAGLHQRADVAPPDSPFGAPDVIARDARQNFSQLAGLPGAAAEQGRLRHLAAWTEDELRRLEPVFLRRRKSGAVRECHGDLHLGNVALKSGTPLLFDAIEFDAGLRWIDVASDVAFLYMDLLDHGLNGLSSRCVNAWLEHTGDYDAPAVLRFYGVYRALVRAKIAALRAQQAEISAPDAALALARFRDYLTLAERLSRPVPAWLAIAAGLPGSGKSTVALAVVERFGAVRVRSDLERKRLAGLPGAARTRSGVGQGIYTPAADQATYARLAELAGAVLDAGYPAIVDATFARRDDRARFSDLARRRQASFAILACAAPIKTLRERLRQRAQEGSDASEATPEVLELQLQRYEPLVAEEKAAAVPFDTGACAPPFHAPMRALEARLDMPAR